MIRYILFGLIGISLGWTGGAEFGRLEKANTQNEQSIKDCIGSLDHTAVVMERQTAILRRLTGESK